MKRTYFAAALVGLISISAAASLRAADEHHGHEAAQSNEQTHQGRGVIESVDTAKGVVTMEHEPINSLRWPKMVMDFKAHDPALLKGLKEGDQVDFDLVKMGKEYHITRISPVR